MKSLTKPLNALKTLTAAKNNGYKTLHTGKMEKKRISFSFSFFKQIENFGIAGKDSAWFTGLTDQLKILSEKEFDDLVCNPSAKQYFRLHPLEFGAGVSALTADDFSFIPDSFRPKGKDSGYWQFQISKANGRVIGFFNEDHTIFYIVFLDPNHNAQLSNYSDYKVRPIEPQVSEIDDLYIKISRLTELDCALKQQGSEFLYQGDNLYMCIDRELFNAFDKLMQDGSLQRLFNEFLLEKL